MKNKILIMPLLFLSVAVQAQFNTASYESKLSSIQVSNFTENDFKGTFLNYHIQGKSNKKHSREEKKKNKERIAMETDSIQTFDEEVQHLSSEKKTIYKKLDPIDYEVIERQLIYMPLNEMKVTSKYGNRFHPIDKEYKFHSGVDLVADDSLVFSVLDGIVLDTGYTKEAGNYMKILHKGHFETIFLHLSKIYYSKDKIIKAGDIIAMSGNTGKSTGHHLHFAVKENGKYIDPIRFLNDLIQTNNAISDYGN